MNEKPYDKPRLIHAWSFFWRSYVCFVALGAVVGFLYAAVMPDGEMAIRMKYTVVSIAVAILFALISKVSSLGVLFLIKGQRLNLSPIIWVKLNLGFILAFLIYGLSNAVVAYFFNVDLWVNYHLFFDAPLFFMLSIGVSCYYAVSFK